MAAEEEEFVPVKYKGGKGRGRGKLCKGEDYSTHNSDGSSDLSFDSIESKSMWSLGGIKSSSSTDFSSDGKETRDLEKGHILGKKRLRSLGRGDTQVLLKLNPLRARIFPRTQVFKKCAD